MRLAWVSILAFFAVSCSKDSHQVRLQAPTSATDVGWVAAGLSEAQIQHLLAEFPKAEVRRIYPKAGLYEFFNVDGPELTARSGVGFVRNRYLAAKPQAIPGPEGLIVGDLHRCKVAEKFPLSRIRLNGQIQPAKGTTTIELGQSLKISARESLAHSEYPGHLKAAIVVVPAKSSMLGQTTITAMEQTYTPDAVGAYRIYVVVQDERDVCAMEAQNVIVTINPPFAKPKSEPRMNIKFLRHLRELQADKVWALSQGEGQVIAVIDSGVNYNHPLLAPNIELNTHETADGEDNDGNGLPDDILGYDFVNSDPFPFDDDGHGSHVAGLAAGRQFGMARKAHILAIKASTALGGDAASAAAAIHYAVDRGARVINLSLGMSEAHALLIEAAAYAEDHGVLLVAAAGNGDVHSGLGFDIDQLPIYPACFPNDNILTVAASDHINPIAPYSNFGRQNVDVVAPGGVGDFALVSLATLNPKGQLYTTMSGTSMAAPLVSAAAAALLSRLPNLGPKEIVQMIMESGRSDPALNKVTRSGRHLDTHALLGSVSF